MRRIVMFNWLTADGYFSGPDGNLNWVVPDDEQARAAVASIATSDTVIFGRVTYERFERFWRHAVEDSRTAPDPHRPGERSREHRAIAIWLNETTKLVFSRTLKDATWKNSRLLHELDPREVEDLWQRLHRVAAHGARFDRRISIRRLPDVPRKRAVVADPRVEEHEAGAPGGQEVPVRRRLASLRARELTLRRFPRQGSLIVF